MDLRIQAPPGVVPWWRRLEPRLDNQEGIDTPRGFADALRDCRAVPFEWWLLNETTGELVRPRCKSPNKCSYCRECAARETVEMLALSAEDHPAHLYVVLTTSEFVTRAELRRDLCKIRRALRRRWPSFEYFCAVEWQKRGALHVNLLVRGVPGPAARQMMSLLFDVWSARHRAVRAAQHVQEVRSSRAAACYIHKLGEYLAKDDQAAPPGWRGHRTSQTRGYFVRPAAELRQEAIVSLRWKRVRARHLAIGRDGCTAGWAAWLELEPRLGDVWGRYQAGPIDKAGLSRIQADADEREALRELWERQAISGHEHIDVPAVVRGHAIARQEDFVASLVDISAVRGVAGEQVRCLKDGRAGRMVDQRCGLREHGVRVESADIADDQHLAVWDGDQACLAGMYRQQLCGVDSAHWRVTFLE